MHFYSISDKRVLKMPLRRFWMLNRNIDRIASEFDLRSIQVSVAKTSTENFKTANENLRAQMGEIIVFDVEDLQTPGEDEELDREGLMGLAGLG